jgi:hypothetical protein
MNQVMPLPEVGSVWKHTNGGLYSVLMITNQHSQNPERYPVTVVYSGANGNTWSRAASDWHRSMTPVSVPNPTRVTLKGLLRVRAPEEFGRAQAKAALD